MFGLRPASAACRTYEVEPYLPAASDYYWRIRATHGIAAGRLLKNPDADHLEWVSSQEELIDRVASYCGLALRAPRLEKKPTPDSAIAIEERMDRLELRVCKPRLDQGRQGIVAVDPSLERRQRVRHLLWGRWHEPSVSGSGATDPVLAGPHLARRLVRPSDAVHEAFVRFTPQPSADGQAIGSRQLGREGIELRSRTDIAGIARAGSCRFWCSTRTRLSSKRQAAQHRRN